MAWGGNFSGELGVGDYNHHTSPTQVPNLSNVTGISSNSSATLSWSGLKSSSSPVGDGRMVVLGDSVAAGEGVNYGFYWTGTGWVQSGPSSPTWNDTTVSLGQNYQDCHQSSAAYSQYFSSFEGYSVNNMACTGASVLPESNQSGSGYTAGGVLRYEQFGNRATPTPNTAVPAQLGSSSSPPCSGCDVANTLFDSNPNAPAVVLLTVGADDIDFGGWMFQCYVYSCGSSSDTSQINTQLAKAQADLRTALTEVNNRAGQDGYSSTNKLTVVVTDYYNPYDTWSSSCIDSGNVSLRKSCEGTLASTCS
jgi:hypothetical protein